MENLKKLQDIFRDVFDEEELEITKETTARDIDDWDSFAQISLIVDIEKEFGVKFNLDEVTELKNVGDMLDLIEKKRG
ncbi:MAG: acyl carrier protein [Cetobacterium sp.]